MVERTQGKEGEDGVDETSSQRSLWRPIATELRGVHHRSDFKGRKRTKHTSRLR